MNKDNLRQEILKQRLSLSKSDLKSRSENIEKRLLQSAIWPRVGSVGLYASVKNEVLTYDLFQKALEQGLHVYFPRVEKGIKFYEVNGPEDLHKGSWGIPEPNRGCLELNLEERHLDLLLVPGIAFSKQGYRIGYGKGFYDQAIKGLQTITVGLAFDFQIQNDLPSDPWDEQLNFVFSERHIHEGKSQVSQLKVESST